jgi:hypothetical protein
MATRYGLSTVTGEVKGLALIKSFENPVFPGYSSLAISTIGKKCVKTVKKATPADDSYSSTEARSTQK